MAEGEKAATAYTIGWEPQRAATRPAGLHGVRGVLRRRPRWRQDGRHARRVGRALGRYGINAVGLMVRRTAKQLGETFERARAIYGPLGAHLVGSAEGGSMRVTMPNGARLIFAHLERDADAENLSGRSATPAFTSRRPATSRAPRRSSGSWPRCAPAPACRAPSGHRQPRRARPPLAEGALHRPRRRMGCGGARPKSRDAGRSADRVASFPSRVRDNNISRASYIANLQSVAATRWCGRGSRAIGPSSTARTSTAGARNTSSPPSRRRPIGHGFARWTGARPSPSLSAGGQSSPTTTTCPAQRVARIDCFRAARSCGTASSVQIARHGLIEKPCRAFLSRFTSLRSPDFARASW